jgi:hypothetical protein
MHALWPQNVVLHYGQMYFVVPDGLLPPLAANMFCVGCSNAGTHLDPMFRLLPSVAGLQV